MMKKKLAYILTTFFLFFSFLYFGVGFYLAHTILFIDPSCGMHEGSLPNTWSTKVDHHEYTVLAKSELRKNFPAKDYYLEDWQEVYFPSRDQDIKISGWLFNYFPNRPIIIIVHGIFPNGKCKPESNLVASLLIKNGINVLTIDLRNYGKSQKISNYISLGATEYNDVLGAYDFLKKIGFNKNQIGLMGISLGANTAIYAASNEKNIKAIWLESAAFADFKMALSDELSRYKMPNIFSHPVRVFGEILSGVDVTSLSPTNSLNQGKQYYYFVHGEKDQRVFRKHFNYFQEYVKKNNINASFWLVENSYHVDAIFKFPEEYGLKMKDFFQENLK